MTIRLRPWLPATLILGITGLGCALYWYGLLQEQRLAYEQVRARAEARAVQLGEALSQELDANLHEVDFALRQVRAAGEQGGAGLAATVKEVLRAYPAGMAAAVVTYDAAGRALFASDAAPRGWDAADSENLRCHRESGADGICFGRPTRRKGAGSYLLLVTRPIREHARLRGAVGVWLSMDELSRRLGFLRVDATDLLAVIRIDGHVIARSHDLEKALVAKVPASRPFLVAAPGTRGVFRSVSTFDGTPMLFSWQRFENWPLATVAAVNETAEFAPLQEAQATGRLRSGVAVAFALFFAAAIATQTTRIQRRTRELRSSESRLHALFAGGRVPMLFIDPADGSIVDANQAAQDFYGYDHPRLCSMHIQEINTLPPGEVADTMRLAQERRSNTFEFPHRLANGQIRRVEVHSGPIEVDGRHLLYSIVHDVSERSRLEAVASAESERNRQYLRMASDGVHILDLDGNCVEASDSFCSMLGYDRASILGMNLAQWDVQQSPGEQIEVRSRLEQGESMTFETRHRSRDGREFPVEIHCDAFDLSGQRLLYCSARDITERKHAEERLRQAASVFHHSHNGIILCDAQERILDVNPAFVRVTGYEREEVIGQTPRILGSARQTGAFYQHMWSAIERDGYWEGEIWNRRKSGEIYPEWLSISRMVDASGRCTHYVAVFSDISEIKSRQARLEQLAHFDPLTKLPNRVLLGERLQRATIMTARDGRSVAVCYMDLDGFKGVNDAMGHEAGDELLIKVARRLEGVLRGEDTLARLGGDEFVVVLTRVSGLDECFAALDRILEAFAQPFEIGEQRFMLSASIGVTLFPRDASDPETLLRHADQAMYQAKQTGRNRYCVFDLLHEEEARSRHEARRRVAEGLAAREFVLHYQPIVDLRDGKVVAFEALARWQHPARGLLGPGEFLRAIEGTAVEFDFGRWVLDAALGQLAQWRATGWAQNVNVNISAHHLLDPDFVVKLRECLARHGLPDGGGLEIEVLETAALEDFERVSAVLEGCRQVGVRIALDDFGTGYSSLSYLRRLPVDTIKVDRSFVASMIQVPQDRAIVRSVIEMAASLGYEVVAEGIESTQIASSLVQMRCHLGQGYAIARPMPAEELARWVATQVGGPVAGA